MSVIVNSKFDYNGTHFDLSIAEEDAESAATAHQHLFQALTGHGLDQPAPAETAAVESPTATPAETQPATPPPTNGATPPPPATQAPAVASADDPAMLKAKQLLAMEGGDAKLTEALSMVGAQTVSTVPKEHHDTLVGWLDHFLAGGTGEQPTAH